MIDAIPISNIDINGLLVLMDLQQTLARRNVRLIWRGCQSESLSCLCEIG